MKIQKLLLTLILIPNISHASISFELNSLFENIFSNKKSEQEKYQEKISEINIAENISKIDPNKLEEAIHIQKTELKNFETKILDLEAEIYELEQQNSELSESLYSLDEELSALEKSFSNISQQEKIWEQKLMQETKNISELRTKIRIEKEALNKSLNKNFIQSKVLGSNDEVSLLQWLFSKKSVSEILFQQKQAAQKQRQQYIRLKNLESLKNELSFREKTAVEMYQKFSGIKKSLEKQKDMIMQLSNNKAQTLKTISNNQFVRERALETYKEKEEEAYAFLIGLQTSHEKPRDNQNFPSTETEPKDTSFFSSLSDVFSNTKKEVWSNPLKTPLRVTAHFLDPIYESQFQKPHFGTDFESPQGSDLLAPFKGTVIKAESNGFEYSYLVLDHGENIYSLYGHLSEILVREGDTVSTGDILGKTGGTPGTPGAGHFTTGPHLHIEIFKENQHINPLEYLENFVE